MFRDLARGGYCSEGALGEFRFGARRSGGCDGGVWGGEGLRVGG